MSVMLSLCFFGAVANSSDYDLINSKNVTFNMKGKYGQSSLNFGINIRSPVSWVAMKGCSGCNESLALYDIDAPGSTGHLHGDKFTFKLPSGAILTGRYLSDKITLGNLTSPVTVLGVTEAKGIADLPLSGELGLAPNNEPTLDFSLVLDAFYLGGELS